ncbi:hypothetical protein K227x_15770 [Rubripirellula lacrimiformis]|uniref:Uncharacterized protein n=1 Tax=Rubripirellula lacrimiformis TaxID=1930273 RepID=A0A517N7S9_9BACT|nr:hypothetical protein [Rubripirellula lacrimiformis]QDT03195.1 hypothetical protein K227x_15770 [Rubripirellula lacrimiformis]
MAIRSIGAKALQQNKSDWVNVAESKSVATNSLELGCAGSDAIDPATKCTPKLRSLRRWLTAGCLGLIVVGSTGCTMTAGFGRSLAHSECIDDFMIGYRNKALAEKAWHCRKSQFGKQCYGKEFKDGFIQGYMEVAQGGYACTPAMAPSKYWGWRYQSANGQGAVNAWFQGFPEGARAAEEDGIGNWSQVSVQTRPTQQPAMAPPPMPYGTPVPIESTPANPFYQEHDIVPGPANFDVPSGASEVIETLAPSNSASFDPTGSSSLSDYESGFDSSQAEAYTAMTDNSDIDIDQVFGASSGSVTISDEDDNSLPFSFE